MTGYSPRGKSRQFFTFLTVFVLAYIELEHLLQTMQQMHKYEILWFAGGKGALIDMEKKGKCLKRLLAVVTAAGLLTSLLTPIRAGAASVSADRLAGNQDVDQHAEGKLSRDDTKGEVGSPNEASRIASDKVEDEIGEKDKKALTVHRHVNFLEGAAGDPFDLDRSVWVVSDEAAAVMEDGLIKVKLFSNKGDVQPMTQLQVYTDFGVPGREQVLTGCNFDPDTLTLSIPEVYWDRDLTVRWFEFTDSRLYARVGPVKTHLPSIPGMRGAWLSEHTWQDASDGGPRLLSINNFTVESNNDLSKFDKGSRWTVQAADIAYLSRASDTGRGMQVYWGEDAPQAIHIAGVSGGPAVSFFPSIGFHDTIDVGLAHGGGQNVTANYILGTCGGPKHGDNPVFSGGHIICVEKGADYAIFYAFINSTRGQEQATVFKVHFIQHYQAAVKLVKASKDAKYTPEKNNAYSYLGARYRVFLDAAGKTPAKNAKTGSGVVLAVGKDGTTNAATVDLAERPSATLYAKEISAPTNQSYLLNPDMLAVQVSASANGTAAHAAEFRAIGPHGEQPVLPTIRTTASDGKNGTSMTKAGREVHIKDTVAYTLVGKLMDKGTGKPVLDAAGKEVREVESFTPKAHKGTRVMDFRFSANPKAIEGHTFVVFETIYESYDQKTGQGTPYVSHEDLHAASQTVHVPAIGTHALNPENGMNFIQPRKHVKVVDHVTYRNLIPGKTYTIKGNLVDQKTGRPLNLAGSASQQNFVPKTPDGSVDLTFTIEDALPMAGKSYVAFEKMFEEGDLEVAAHEDLTDHDQTIFVPARLHTTATDDRTKNHLAFAGEKTSLTDTVTYAGLEPGRTYTLTGRLMNLDTEKELATVSANIIPKDSEEHTDRLSFALDAAALKGVHTVVYESLTSIFKNERTGQDETLEVASHADQNDRGQQVHFPEIGTSLVDTANKNGVDKEVLAGPDVELCDHVSFRNLLPGLTYIVKGTLMDRETGKPALDDRGNEITAETTIGKEELQARNEDLELEPMDGTADVILHFDGTSLAGHSLTAYETVCLKSGNDEILVAKHEDLQDAGQTISLPRIRTELTDQATGKHEVPADAKVNLFDRVSYHNLILGETYVMRGTLIDKETETAIGQEAQQIFTPETADGAVEMTFTADTLSAADHHLVAFEELSRKDKILAEHKDKEDKNQTVFVRKPQREKKTPKEEKRIPKQDKKSAPKTSTTAVKSVKTGDHPIALLITLFLASGVLAVVIIGKRKRA